MKETEIEKNTRVAEALCVAVVQQGIAKSAKFIKAGKDLDEDATIELEGKRVDIELVEYRRSGPHKENEEADQELCAAIREMLVADSRFRGFNLSFAYCAAGVVAGTSGFAVPKRSVHAKVAQQVVRLIAAVQDLSHWQSTRAFDISFDGPENARAYNDADPSGVDHVFWAMNANEYPLLAKHFSVIRTREWTAHYKPCVQSDLDIRCVMNEPSIAKDLARKKIKKYPAGKGAKECRPFWLVVHSGGWPQSAFIDLDHRSELHDAVKSEFAGASTAFTAVYWFDLDPSGGLDRIV